MAAKWRETKEVNRAQCSSAQLNSATRLESAELSSALAADPIRNKTRNKTSALKCAQRLIHFRSTSELIWEAFGVSQRWKKLSLVLLGSAQLNSTRLRSARRARGPSFGPGAVARTPARTRMGGPPVAPSARASARPAAQLVIDLRAGGASTGMERARTCRLWSARALRSTELI